jgi:hypothetical protein
MLRIVFLHLIAKRIEIRREPIFRVLIHLPIAAIGSRPNVRFF